MINNGIKANAVIAAPMFLTFIIEACESLLVGSGIVAQNQFNTMSTTDVFDTTSSVITNTPELIYPDPIFEASKSLAKFINSSPESNLAAQILRSITVKKGGGSSNNNNNKPDSIGGALLSFGFLEWVKNHTDNLEEVTVGEGFDMKGYGAVYVFTHLEANGSIYYRIYYMDYGLIISDTQHKFFTNDNSKIPTETYYSYNTNDIRYSSVDSPYFTSIFGLSDVNLYLYGDWRYEDSTPADDKTTSSESETKPADIGEVEVDGQSYPVAGDGTVAIGDNTYPINEDGSVTIDGKKYYPEFDLSPYDDTAIIDLLNQILQQIQVTDDGNPAKEVIDNAVVEVPLDIANSELASLEMPKSIATVFPFCIPWDFYNGLQLLAQKPKAPRFEVPFEIPQFGLFPGYKSVIVLDFADYEDTFAVVRWVTFTLFMFVLCFITFKIVKGA